MSLLSGLFSDIFARQDNPLSRLDPRTKLILAITLLLFVAFSTGPRLPFIVMIFSVSATVFVGVPVRVIALRMVAPLGIAMVLVVLQSLLTGSTAYWSAALAGFTISVSHEGLDTGLQMAERVISAVSVMQLLASVTPAHRIFHALRSLGAPQGWVEIALLMYRYIFALLDLTADMTAAQRLRLGYSGIRRGLCSAGIVAGTVLLRSLDQAERTNEAMRVRGYRGQIPLAPLPPMARREWWIMAAAICIMSGLFLVAGRKSC